MGVRPVIFESAGRRTTHVIPGVYSRNASIKGKSGGVSAGNVAILGYSIAGMPGKLLEFGSLEEAQAELKGGELLDAIAHFFSPAKGYVPQNVFAVRVGDAMQATCTLKRNNKDVVKIYTQEYGAGANEVHIQFEYDVDEHKAHISLTQGAVSSEIITVYEPLLEIVYTGDGTNATCSITKEKLELKVEGHPDESAVFPFDEYPTIDSLCINIKALPNFDARLSDIKKKNTSSDELDARIISITKDIPFSLYANLYGIARALMQDKFVGKVEILSEENIIPDNLPNGVFRGGKGSEGLVEEWQTAIKTLEKEDINIITTPCQNPDIHNLIVGHCEIMSSIENKKERTCILGGGLNESVENSIKRAKILNSTLCSYTGTSIKAINPLTGGIVTLPASFFACKLAGLESCLAVNHPLTNKVVNVLEFVNKYTPTELKRLILGGVLSGGKNDDGRLVVIRAITTYEGDELQDLERSMVREAIYMNRDLRYRLNPAIGTPCVSGSLNEVLAVLRQASNDWFASGLILKSEDGDCLWDIATREDGDAIFITFSRYLVAPRNFVFITANNHVYSGSSTTVAI